MAAEMRNLRRSMRCSNTMIRSTVWALVMSGNRRCTGPDRPERGININIMRDMMIMMMVTDQGAVDHHSNDPHDLHRCLPTSDIL